MLSINYKQKFKCEDLSVAPQIFDKGFCLFKFDLKSGYYHIEIFPEHRQFLAFNGFFQNSYFPLRKGIFLVAYTVLIENLKISNNNQTGLVKKAFI